MLLALCAMRQAVSVPREFKTVESTISAETRRFVTNRVECADHKRWSARTAIPALPTSSAMRGRDFASPRFDAPFLGAQRPRFATHLQKGACPNPVLPTSNARPVSFVTKHVASGVGPARMHAASVSLASLRQEKRMEVASRDVLWIKTALSDNSVT